MKWWIDIWRRNWPIRNCSSMSSTRSGWWTLVRTFHGLLLLKYQNPGNNCIMRGQNPSKIQKKIYLSFLVKNWQKAKFISVSKKDLDFSNFRSIGQDADQPASDWKFSGEFLSGMISIPWKNSQKSGDQNSIVKSIKSTGIPEIP